MSLVKRSWQKFCSVAAPQEYPFAMKIAHWGMGVGLIGGVLFVKKAQWTPKEDEKTKGYYMRLHKSFGLLMAACIIPRVLLRRSSKIPLPPPDLEIIQKSGQAAHLSLYGFMILMPFTGVLMGYFSGYGLPFFGYTIPGAERNPTIAKYAYLSHSWIGFFFEFAIPLHISAAGYHTLRGHQLLKRMNPFN